jgi:CubicO group peptidase (beta-lactamase class C family)
MITMMNGKRVFLIFISVVLMLSWGPVQAGSKSDDLAKLKGFEAFVNRILAEHKVPGVAISIVKDGKLLYAQGFGLKDIQNGLKVTPHTLFGIGSCSKAFTATTMGILVDEGKLEWDKPVRYYMPTFTLSDPVTSEQMKARDLVCHRSGLPRHDKMWYKSPLSRRELFDRLRYLDFSRGFREVYQYNNLMFMTAGILVESVAGGPWEEFARKRILDPLGMTETNFSVEDSRKAADFALPYQESNGKAEAVPFCNVDAIAPAGAINSNVLDMARWVLMNLNKGTFGDKGEKRIISEAALAQIHSPQVVIPDSPKYDELFYGSYAMGWRIGAYRGHLLVFHGGSIDGFSATVSMMPKAGIGIVLLNNLEDAAINATLAYNIYDRLLGMNPIDWNARINEDQAKAKADAEKTKKESEKDRKPDTKPSHPLEDYVGTYEHPAYGPFAIRKDEDHLAAEFHSMTFALSHFHYDTFLLKNDLAGLDERLTFIIDSRGDIGSLAIKLEPAVKEIVFQRVPKTAEGKK